MIEFVIIIILMLITAILYGWCLKQDDEINKLEREIRWLRKLVREND